MLVSKCWIDMELLETVHVAVLFVKNKKQKKNQKLMIKNRMDNSFEFLACHQVVRCRSNECATCWHREENSSNNHLKLLLCYIREEERTEYMHRGCH